MAIGRFERMVSGSRFGGTACGSADRRAARRRKVYCAWTSFIVGACSGASPAAPCNGQLLVDVAVARVTVANREGVTLPGFASRRDAPVPLRDTVRLEELWRLDSSSYKGRAAMELRVWAVGYAPADVSLAQTCSVTPTPVRIVLDRQ